MRYYIKKAIGYMKLEFRGSDLGQRCEVGPKGIHVDGISCCETRGDR